METTSKQPNMNLMEEDNKITIVPYKKKYLQIFKGKSYYLLDRYKYDQNAIMMLLELNKINKLGDIFVNYPDGIEKIKFIQIMKAELPSNPNDPMDETNLIYGLYKCFCKIDFNGDGHMQWEEFTQFIIDTVEGDNDAKVDEGDEDSKNKIFNEKQMIKYKRYHISNRIKDSNIHKKDIIDAVFLPRSDTLLINEYGTKVLRIYNPKTGKNEKIFKLDNFLNPTSVIKNNSNSRLMKSTSYEGLFVQDIQKKIDNIIVNEVPHQGINEITLNVIKKIVDDQDNIRTITSSIINANVKLTKGHSQSNKFNAIPTMNSQTTTSGFNMYNNTTTQNAVGKSYKNTNANKEMNMNTSKTQLKPILSLTSTKQKFYTASKSKKKEYNPKFRDTLYAEKLFNKISNPFAIDKRSTIQTTVSNKESDNKSKTFFNISSMRNRIMLPYIKEKIIFKKGETDKLLNYEFYMQSYKNCCEINGLTNIPNKSLQKSYKNNWKMVDNYTRSLRNETDQNEQQSNHSSIHYFSANTEQSNM